MTSREPLRLTWEHLLPVPPLALPEVASPAAASIVDSPAVQLFLLRARAVQPELAPSQEELRGIAEVCSLLDGLPLAIELAAAQSDVVSPAELLASLEHQRLDVVSLTQDAPARHRSLRASIGSSYERLSAPEQTLFRR